MRIAVWHNLPSGGGKRALHDHVRGLVTRGHLVESWSPPTADRGYMPLAPYAVEHVVPLDPPAPASTGKLGRRLHPFREMRAAIAAMDRHSLRCVQEMSAGRFDVVFANSCAEFAAPALGRFTPLPSVLYLQEPYRLLYEATATADGKHMEWAVPPCRPAPAVGWRGWKRRTVEFVEDSAYHERIRLQARAESRNAHGFDRVLCNSRYSREVMLRTYGLETSTCYLGIDIDAFPLFLGPKEPFVVGLGAFGGRKGIDLAIRAVATIESSQRPELVWIGNHVGGEYLARITALAETLEVRFRAIHMATQTTLADLLGRAAAMIYTARLEPFGYAPLEANACGTAVVGLAEGGIRESIEPGRNGVLVDGGDPEALGHALSRYVRDLDMAREAGLQARQHVVDHWSVALSVDRLEQHLEAVFRAAKPAGAVPR